LDASACVRPDAAADVYPEPHFPGEGVEKLAAPVSDVPEPDARSLPPQPLAPPVWEVPCTPDEVRSAERSCGVTALADALAQLESLVSRRQPVAVEQRQTTAPLKLEARLAPPASSHLADGPDAQELESSMVEQSTQVAERPVAREPKMSASRASPER